MIQPIRIEILIILLLLTASVVAVIVRHFRIPYTVALVLAGLALSFQSSQTITLEPELFLLLFLPPLLFDAAFHLNVTDLRRNIRTIALLAVPGVILSTLLVGGVVAWGAGLSLGIAFVFGALITATDPMAVVAIFRQLGVPKRLTVLLEGESLFNDGTAIVIFELALAAFITGEFSVVEGLVDFVRVAGGGIITGLALGWLVTQLMARIDDHLVETTLTTVLAFGSYLLAGEIFHVSGVLAVVAAGLTAGSIGPRGMSPTTRILVNNFWEYIAFLANSFLFLIIGFQIDLTEIINNWQTILVAILAVLISRAFVIYLVSGIQGGIPMRWRHILFWGGLRGGIALALAFSLPLSLGPDRDRVIAMTFGVVLFTLLAQGISMGWLVRRLKIIFRSEGQLEYERRHARAIAASSGYDHLKGMRKNGLISSHTWSNISGILAQRVEELTDAVQEALQDAPEVEIDELITARRQDLRAQKSTLADLRHEGVISDETHEVLIEEIDVALETGVEVWARRILASHVSADIEQVFFAIIRAKHVEETLAALAAQGIPATQFSSTGGNLNKKNFALVVGVPVGRLEIAIEVLKKSTSGKVEFLQDSMLNMPTTAGPGIPVRVGGATIFLMDVDYFEEILS